MNRGEPPDPDIVSTQGTGQKEECHALDIFMMSHLFSQTKTPSGRILDTTVMLLQTGGLTGMAMPEQCAF